MELNTNSKSFIKNCIFYSFISLFVFIVIKTFFIQKYFSKYVFQEWLVNYSQGFVRRGLIGTFFLFIHTTYDISLIDIYNIIRYFAYATFLLFSSIYIFKVRQSKKILDWESLVVVLFLPSLILFPINDMAVIGRKEFLFFFGLLINLFFVKKALKILNINSDRGNTIENSQSLADTVNKYCYSLFIWYNLLSIPTTLSHEAIIFLALPLNMIITANLIGLAFSAKQVLWRTLIIYSPTILVAFLCLIFKGNKTIALGICESWQEYSYLYKRFSTECIENLSAVLFSFKDILKLVFITNVYQGRGASFLSWIFAFLLNIVILMRTSSSIIRNSVENIKRKFYREEDYNFPSPVNIVTSFSFKYAFIPFVFSSILYVFALDWGRWFFIISITYTLCLLSPSLLRLEIASHHQNKWMLEFLSPIYLIYAKAITYLSNQFLLQRFYPIYFLGLIYTLFVLKIAHYNMAVRHLFQGLIHTLYHVLLKN